jgi:hypothetical protein
MKRVQNTNRSEAVCRQALSRGPLTAFKTGHGLAWKFGRRMFNTITVSRLIAAGEAVRDGDEVRAA